MAFRQKDMPHDQQVARCDRCSSLHPIFRNHRLRANGGTCDDRDANSYHDPFYIGDTVHYAVEG
ncbi:hypothetical protein thsrh120_58460 [Rhizobium sp. No.120]